LNKQELGTGQAIGMTAVFILGASTVIGGHAAKQDAWISLLAAFCAAIPLVLMLARISALNPGKNLFEIIFGVLGKAAGWVIALLTFLYAFQMGALTLRIFTEFVQTVSLNKTPQMVVGLVLMGLCAYAVWQGGGVMGRLGAAAAVFVGVIIVLSFVLLTGNMDIKNIQPVMSQPAESMVCNALEIFSFSLAETVLMLCLMGNLKSGADKFSRYKIFLLGLTAGSALLLTGILSAVLTLGGNTFYKLNFPVYVAASLIDIGNFLHRIEGLISSNMVLCVFVRLTVCLFACAQGGEKLLGLKDRKILIIPIALLMGIASALFFGSAMDVFRWVAEIYPLYALPFQVGLPVLLWVVSELKARNVQKSSAASSI